MPPNATPDFTISPLGRDHDRAGFSCGNPSLDDFIRTKARKEVALGYCAVFVLSERAGAHRIACYYTLSAHAMALDGIDAAARKKLPRYPLVPTTLIGRVARDLRFRGSGAGELLLMDALNRAHRSAAQIGAHAVAVDAVDDAAAKFYLKFGFIAVPGHTNRFYLSMATITQIGL